MKKLSFVIALATALGLSNVRAEVYPSHPITIIVPFAAGGPTDTLARVLSEPMRTALDQPIIVENVTGAGATIGVGRAAGADPDGYTLVLGNWSSFVGAPALYPVHFNVLTDFEPISLVSFAPLMLVGKNALPVKDAKELIAWLKANRDKVSAATVGAGMAAHLCGLYFQSQTGTRFQFVPY